MELTSRPSESQVEISINSQVDTEIPTETSRARNSRNKKVHAAAIGLLALGVTGGVIVYACKSDDCKIAGAVLLGVATCGIIMTTVAACFLRLSRI
jgi:hypothetical protein